MIVSMTAVPTKPRTSKVIRPVRQPLLGGGGNGSRTARPNLQPSSDLSGQRPLGGLLGAYRTVLVNSGLERYAALLDHEADLIADGEEIRAFTKPRDLHRLELAVGVAGQP